MTSFVPRLTLGDCQDMRLSSPPPALLGELYSVALVEVWSCSEDWSSRRHWPGRRQ